MTKEDFFNNNDDTNFIDRVCAFLDISTDKLKIVGVRNEDEARLLRGRSLAAGVLVLDVMLDGGPIGGETG